MLLPDKHVSLAESVLGLGAFVLGILEEPMTPDKIHSRVLAATEGGSLPARHGYDSVTLALLFLYSVDAVEMTEDGGVRRCAS